MGKWRQPRLSRSCKGWGLGPGHCFGLCLRKLNLICPSVSGKLKAPKDTIPMKSISAIKRSSWDTHVTKARSKLTWSRGCLRLSLRHGAPRMFLIGCASTSVNSPQASMGSREKGEGCREEWSHFQAVRLI